MEIKFQIVTLNGGEMLTREEVESRFELAERTGPAHVRKELQNQPEIKGLCGPMWGGWYDEDGEHVFLVDDKNPDGERQRYGSQKPIAYMALRYESWEAYEAYSR